MDCYKHTGKDVVRFIHVGMDSYTSNIANPSREGQNIFVLNIEDYAYVVPYVEDDVGIYLKTVFPSRKYTKLFFK